MQQPSQPTADAQQPAKSGTALLVVLLVALFLAAAFFSFMLFGGGELLFPSTAAPGYQVSGPVRALRLAPPDATDEPAVQAYFTQAVAFAQDNGFNTLVFEAKQGSTVWWRDDIFAPVPGLAEQDGGLFGQKMDPLALLCRAVAGKDIQLWLAVDVFSASAPAADSTAKVDRLLAENPALAAGLGPQHSAYTALLADSLAALPRRYSLGGLVLEGFAAPANTTPTTQDKDAYASAVQPLIEDIHGRLAGQQTPLVLAFDENSDMIAPEFSAGLVAAGTVQHQLAAIHPDTTSPEATARLGGRVARYGQNLVLQHTGDDTMGLVLFTASQSAAYNGVLLGRYPAAAEQLATYAHLESVLTPVGSPLPTGFDIPRHLEVTYPVDGRNLTWDGVYITGHSNPAAPLLLNGAEVPGRAANGAFGVFVPLELGDNTFTFQNGDVTGQKVITRVEPKPTTPIIREDGTREAKPGQVIEIAVPFCNVLKDPADFSTINELFGQGARAVVQESRQFELNGYRRWAYRLTSGDWVWATNVTWVQGDGASAFTGITAQPHDKGEMLLFEGNGTPAAYLAYGNEDGSLTLTFHDTTLALPEGFSSQLVAAARTEAVEGGVALTLQTNDIWGYSIEYENGQTRLFLKRPPQRGANPARPLEGVHVMLDPGHGASTEGANYGAVGIAGENGYPHEKDINMALCQAIAYRLRQMGATVAFTREDDTNHGINQRFLMQQAEKVDFFISVHHDGLDGNTDLTDKARLLGIYYHPYNIPPSQQFAQNLLRYVAAGTGLAAEDAPRWGGVNYGVIRTTVCPSVLFEYGLIVHPHHYDVNTSAEGIWAAGFATAEAILATLPA